MIMRFLAIAVAAGALAGIFVSAVQAVRVTPLIYHAETYEKKSAKPAAKSETKSTEHTHKKGTPAHSHSHSHDGEAWGPSDGFERVAFTVMANILVGVGFALLLVAAMVFADGVASWKTGLLWGAAGFLSFALAPALGLPPDPPGVDAGSVSARQVWWIGTAAATGVGLWLLVLVKHFYWKALGILLIALPHVIGAPHINIHGGPVPSALITEFVIASLVTTALFWLILGASTGALFRRFLTPTTTG